MTTITPTIANRIKTLNSLKTITNPETLRLLKYSIYALHKKLYQRYNSTASYLYHKEGFMPQGNADILRISQLHELAYSKHPHTPSCNAT